MQDQFDSDPDEEYYKDDEDHYLRNYNDGAEASETGEDPYYDLPPEIRQNEALIEEPPYPTVEEVYQFEVKNALDKAIAAVAGQELARLTKGLNDVQIAKQVVGALHSLDRLRFGNIPNYDEWDAIFYHWYQPSHINLAYSMIEWSHELSDQLHIVDFGCGALAMQFGVALAAADAIKQGQSITEIKIDSIDTSQAMVDIGQKIWEQLKREIGRTPNLSYLDRAYEVIKPIPLITREKGDIERIGSAPNSNVWGSAIHAFYDDNKDDVQCSLKSLVDRLTPDICFASTHIASKKLLSEVWSFADRNYDVISHDDVQHHFFGTLDEITQWRKKLNSNLPQIDPILWRFLNNPVTWKWADSTFCIYTRR